MSPPQPLRAMRSTLILFLLVAAPSSAQEKQPTVQSHTPKSANVDRESVGLPKGAIARFGSMRFRHGGITDFVFAPDGATVLTAGRDGMARRWDLKTGKQSRATRLLNTGELAERITLSPNGNIALLERHKPNEHNTEFSFLDVPSGKLLRKLDSLIDEPVARALSPDGSAVAYSTRISSISNLVKTTMQDRQTGQERELSFRNHKRDGTIVDGCFAPNGQWYAVAGNEEEPVQIREFVNGNIVCELSQKDSVGMSFSADSRELVVSCAGEEPDKKPYLRFLRLPGGEETRRIRTEMLLNTIALSHDAKLVAGVEAGSLSAKIFMIDVASGRVVQSFETMAQKLLFSPDDKTLGSLWDSLRLWDVTTGREKTEQTGGFVFEMAGSLDGKWIAAVDFHRDVISVWDVNRQDLIRQLPTEWSAGLIHQLGFGVDNKLIQFVADGTDFCSWDIATGKKSKAAQVRAERLNGRQMNYLMISPDGRYLADVEYAPTALANEKMQAEIREIVTSKTVHSRKFPKEWLPVLWMPDGKSILFSIVRAPILMNGASSYLRELIFMNITSGVIRSQIKVYHDKEIFPSFDGRLLASKFLRPGKDTWLNVLDSLTGEQVAFFSIPESLFLADPIWVDSRSLVLVTKSNIELRDVLTGKTRYLVSTEFENGEIKDEARVMRARLLPNRRHLLTSQFDHSGLLWDLTPGLPAHPDSNRAVDDALAAQWWNDLASEKPLAAYQAVWRFVDSPRAVPFLIKRLKELVDPDNIKARDLIRKLDDNSFRTREKAQEELGTMGLRALESIRDAQGSHPSPEVARRLATLAADWETNKLSGSILRRLRAMQVLEEVNSSECRQLLEELAANASSKAEREEAQAVLERLK